MPNMAITSHATGAVIVRGLPDGTVLCVRMKYANHRGWSFRHMMETGENGETVLETLRNGLLDEIVEDKNALEYRLVKPEPIVVEFGPDQNHYGGLHMKTFFLVELVGGGLRTKPINDGKEVLDPPEYVEAEHLLKSTEGKTTPIHWRSTFAAIKSLSVDKLVFQKYENLLLDHGRGSVILSTSEREMILAYPKRW